jgi:cytochrome b
MTTDWGWGSEVLEEVHEALVNGLIACVVLHVGAVIFESIRHKESLVKAMVTGKKKIR